MHHHYFKYVIRLTTLFTQFPIVGNEAADIHKQEMDIKMKKNAAYEPPPSRIKMTENEAYGPISMANRP